MLCHVRDAAKYTSTTVKHMRLVHVYNKKTMEYSIVEWKKVLCESEWINSTIPLNELLALSLFFCESDYNVGTCSFLHAASMGQTWGNCKMCFLFIVFVFFHSVQSFYFIAFNSDLKVTNWISLIAEEETLLLLFLSLLSSSLSLSVFLSFLGQSVSAM